MTIPGKYIYVFYVKLLIAFITFYSFYSFTCLAMLNQKKCFKFFQLVLQHQTVTRDFKSSNRIATGV